MLELEAAGIAALGQSLDESFGAAVELLHGVEGRVIVTGMGKSGHIARKIAATMASTGTQAYFVHPAEASHGDLGMIDRSDAILCLSNSGETTEMSDLLIFAKRFGIPLLAIVGKRDSTLAKAATVALLLPGAAEACPMGLAPTTSTTMMLALGDALAVALLDRKGFSSDQFQVLHPGGRLGRSLVKVVDIMHVGDAVPLIGPDADMAQAILTITAKSFGCVGVVEDDRLVGVITDGDLRRHADGGWLNQKVRDVMTRGPQTIRADALAAEALGRMNAPPHPITSLFVVEDERPVGILHIHDCLRAGIR